MKKSHFVILLIGLMLSSITRGYSQFSNSTWKGTAKQDANTYSYIIKIDKVKGDSVFGATISSNKVFYSETSFKGKVTGNSVSIKETTILKTNYKGTGSVCLMTLSLQKTNDKLVGNFTSSNKEIKDCGSGTVDLALVKEKKKETPKIESTKDSPVRVSEPKVNTVSLTEAEQPKKTVTIQQPTLIKSQRKVEQRDIEILNTFKFNEDSVTIKIYDNGVIDGDVISLIVNGSIVFDKIKLTSTPLVYQLKASIATQFQIEFFAETLGEIPPNTGLISISSATKTSEVLFSSDLKKSAAIKVLLNNNP